MYVPEILCRKGAVLCDTGAKAEAEPSKQQEEHRRLAKLENSTAATRASAAEVSVPSAFSCGVLAVKMCLQF